MKKKGFLTYDEKYLKAELTKTQNALDAAYCCFEYAVEPDLVDSSIYQVDSVWKRYTFLMNRAKEMGIM